MANWLTNNCDRVTHNCALTVVLEFLFRYKLRYKRNIGAKNTHLSQNHDAFFHFWIPHFSCLPSSVQWYGKRYLFLKYCKLLCSMKHLCILNVLKIKQLLSHVMKKRVERAVTTMLKVLMIKYNLEHSKRFQYCCYRSADNDKKPASISSI